MTATLLRGGTVFDGVSPKRQNVSVLVAEGLVQQIGSNIPVGAATTVIDIEGRWLLPGFIDPHSHADAAMATGEQMEIRAHSGVTTEIVGQDGLGLSHAKGPASEQMIEILTPVAGNLSGLLRESVADYLALVDAGSYARVGSLSPHGTIRAKVVGRDLVPASEAQLSAMSGLFSEDMKNGALGLSSGLSYPPALASNTEELVAMLLAVGPGTLYVTHLRSYGEDFDVALDEATDITHLSGCQLHLSHFHVSGPGRDSRARDYLSRLSRLAPSPTLDSYPYRHACTFLTALLPSSLTQLSYTDLQELLRSGTDAVVEQLFRSGPEATIAVGWAELLLAGLTGQQLPWNGLSLAEIADNVGKTPEAIVCDVIISQERTPMVLVPQGHPSNIREIARSSMQVVGSDGIFGSGGPHPRLAGTFFRFLRLAIDGEIPITVEQAVAKMTSKTASIFGIKAGVIAPGFPADLLVIDPALIDGGDDVVVRRPEAIQHVFIGGEQTIKQGVWQGRKLSGMAVRGRR